MSTAREQLMVATAAVGVFLSLNILEIQAKRATIDSPLATLASSAVSQGTASWREFFITQGVLLSVELGPSINWGHDVETPDARPAPRVVHD